MSVVGPIAAKKLQGRECSEVFSLQQNSLVIRSSRPHRRTPAIRGTGRYGICRVAASLRLDARELDHLAPFLGFVGDELAEVGGRAARAPSPPRSASRAFILGSARAALISLLSLSTISAGVFFGAPTPIPDARLVARHEFAHGRDVRQRLRARRGGHRQRAQLAGPDVLDRRRQCRRT